MQYWFRWSGFILAAIALGLGVAPAAAQLRYQASLDDSARTLRVSACTVRALEGGELIGAGWRRPAFVTAVDGDGASAPVLRGQRIAFGPLAAGQCLRYAVDVVAAADADRYRLGRREDQHLLVPLNTWLWRPEVLPDGSTLRLRLPDGWQASLPYPKAADASHYLLSHTPADWDGSSAFGRFSEQILSLAGGQLRLTVLPPANAGERARLRRWVEKNAEALLAASGRLPLPDVQVLVVPLPGKSTPVPWGQVTRAGASAVKLFVGLDASERALLDDWTLSHELSHLLHPYLYTRGRWLSEGLASYYQNVLRARSGALSAGEAWRKLDAGFQRGRGERGGSGHTLAEVAAGNHRSTMRVYWSGAAYWLEAEMQLRHRHGIDLAQLLDRFAKQHLPATEQWRPERFAATLDRMVGDRLFLPLFERYQASTQFPSLAHVYRRLGLGSDVGELTFDDRAPGADIRGAIMRGSAQSQAKVDGRPVRAETTDSRGR